MAKKARGKYELVRSLTQGISDHHVSAYAAQSAFFFVFSMIPIILLLLSIVPYLPITEDMMEEAIMSVFPSNFGSQIYDIIKEVSTSSGAIASVTYLIVVLWAAGKGVMALTSGLNSIYDYKETRAYVFLRLRATFYTVLFILAIVLLLVLSVFGGRLTQFAEQYIPVLRDIVGYLVSFSTFVSPVLMVGFMLLVYRFLPNRKATFLRQLPGAVFTSVGWMLISWFFSMYLDIFTGFSTMYGSMRTIILIMLWFYFIMYIALLGGELNVIISERILDPRKKAKEETASLKAKEEAVPENKEEAIPGPAEETVQESAGEGSGA